MLEYIWSVWQAIHLGLGLHPDVVQVVESHPNAQWIAFGVVMVAGISLLLGQSVILFLNQVSPGRFVVSLVTNGLLVVVGWVIWSWVVWGIGRQLFDEAPAFSLVLIVIGLSYAPEVFGFLILMPYLGPFVQRLLFAWSFVIALRAVAFTFQVSYWPALICVGIGWAVVALLTATIGRPVVTLRNWIWHSITGTPKNASPREVIAQFAQDQSLPPPSVSPQAPSQLTASPSSPSTSPAHPEGETK